jgi:hypothetical protein
LPDDWRGWAQQERPDLDPEVTACRFADFWRGKAGKDARKVDWQATWRNWVRNERRAAPAAAESFRERDDRLARERAAGFMGRPIPASATRQSDFIDVETRDVTPPALGR